jgi:small nuclear ribonucleoprotein (snRNP)-like protein
MAPNSTLAGPLQASDEQLNTYLEERSEFLGLIFADRPFPGQDIGDPAL